MKKFIFLVTILALSACRHDEQYDSVNTKRDEARLTFQMSFSDAYSDIYSGQNPSTRDRVFKDMVTYGQSLSSAPGSIVPATPEDVKTMSQLANLRTTLDRVLMTHANCNVLKSAQPSQICSDFFIAAQPFI